MSDRKKPGVAFWATVAMAAAGRVLFAVLGACAAANSSGRSTGMMRKAFVIAIVASGCRPLDSVAPAVPLPPAAEIDAIEVTPNFGETRSTHRITDQRRIQQFAEFINERSDAWVHPSDTFPSGRYTVVVLRNGEPGAVFWPAAGHIGGRAGNEGAQSNRLRKLDDREWQLLQSILELPVPTEKE